MAIFVGIVACIVETAAVA